MTSRVFLCLPLALARVDLPTFRWFVIASKMIYLGDLIICNLIFHLRFVKKQLFKLPKIDT